MYKNYYIDKLENEKINIVKVMNEYETMEEAKEDLFKLISGDKDEKQLLKEYSNKTII